MKRHVQASLLLAAVVVTVGLGMTIFKERTHGAVHILNLSGDEIRSAKVQVSGKTLHFETLQPSQKVTDSFSIGKDSHYEILVEFVSGKSLRGSCGYVTSGIESSVIIRIFTDEIRIEDSVSGRIQIC